MAPHPINSKAATRFALALCALAITACSAWATDHPPKLNPEVRGMFCGYFPDELSREYGEAVNAEVRWRMKAGARTPAQALVEMRGEYCGGHVAGVKK